jgi:hypothetical protein
LKDVANSRTRLLGASDRNGATFVAASHTSTWPRDHFCRSTIARGSSPTMWNDFFPMSMPVVATVSV